MGSDMYSCFDRKALLFNIDVYIDINITKLRRLEIGFKVTVHAGEISCVKKDFSLFPNVFHAYSICSSVTSYPSFESSFSKESDQLSFGIISGQHWSLGGRTEKSNPIKY